MEETFLIPFEEISFESISFQEISFESISLNFFSRIVNPAHVWCSHALCSTRQTQLIPIGISEKKSLPSCLLSEFCTILDMAKKFCSQSIFIQCSNTASPTQRRMCITYVAFIAHWPCPTRIAEC